MSHPTPTPISDSRRPVVYVVRRQSSGGGAETAAARLVEHLSASWEVHRLAAGSCIAGSKLAGGKGPGWWRALRFAADVDAALADRPGVILNLERGPKCHVYRAGDGVHLRWRSLRFGRSPLWMTNPLHWLYPRLESKTVTSARLVVSNSEMVRREMERTYPQAAHKLRVVLNGFDPRLFFPSTDPTKPPTQALNLPGNIPKPCRLFLFVGSGWQRKGLARALELLTVYNQAVMPNEPRGVLLVVGKGRPEQYRSLLRRWNLDSQVHFLGVRSELTRLYQAADVLVLPTLYDPFANACLEAMACDCPVLTTANNGAAEVIAHGRTGYVLKNSLGNDLADAVHWLRTAARRPGEVAESVASLTVDREMRAFSALMRELSSSAP
ncbi:glycosyltransferase family 4 protein [Desulfonatronum thiodismutans]|uniref:glycosyltransferase family 4 protein n=1 Tax=Desulfonatronum thiodismutans TaxID=159290 RepID=UPI0004ABD5D9|nr:glycosyltransferase family 4 protein [Desulfonatronum thiodismutans]